MSHVFILQNHKQFFLTKELTWTDGRNPTELFRTTHKDEAVNQMFEVNSKDYSQRISILSCETTQRGVPILDPEWLPEITSEEEVLTEQSQPTETGDTENTETETTAQAPETEAAREATETDKSGASSAKDDSITPELFEQNL